MAARKDAKTTDAQAVSEAGTGRKRVVGQRVSGSNRAKPVRRGPAPAAGDRLRAELGREGDSFSVLLLIEQAARNADRLDRINDMLAGDSTAWFEVEIAGQVAEVRVTNLVVEERQRSAALAKILVDIARMRGDGVKQLPAGGGKGKSAVSPIARIQQRRKA